MYHNKHKQSKKNNYTNTEKKQESTLKIKNIENNLIKKNDRK